MRHASRPEDRFFFGVSRQDDPRARRADLAHMLEEFRAVHARHPHVGDDNVDRFLLDQRKGFLTPFTKVHVPLLAHRASDPFDALKNARLVINKDD